MKATIDRGSRLDFGFLACVVLASPSVVFWLAAAIAYLVTGGWDRVWGIELMAIYLFELFVGHLFALGTVLTAIFSKHQRTRLRSRLMWSLACASASAWILVAYQWTTGFSR